MIRIHQGKDLVFEISNIMFSNLIQEQPHLTAQDMVMDYCLTLQAIA